MPPSLQVDIEWSKGALGLLAVRAGLACSRSLPQGTLGTALSPAMLPLPILIHAVDNGIALLNEGHELMHQHLLSAPVLLCPVLLCPR